MQYKTNPATERAAASASCKPLRAFFNVLLAIVLIVGFTPIASATNAYADEDSSASSEISDESASSEDAAINDLGVGEFSSGEGSASGGSGSSSDNGDNAAEATEGDTSVSASTDGEVVADTSAFEFIYVDQKTIGLGETQSIAISFLNQGDASTSMLYYQRVADAEGNAVSDEVRTAVPTQVADGAALYEITFSDEAELGEYQLVKASWEGDEPGEAAISDDTSTGYSFCVAEIVDEDGDEGSCEEGITAYTLDDDGNLVEEESIEEAIGQADDSSVVSSAQEEGIAVLSESDDDTAVSTASTGMVIALDPGHGGSDSGATSGSLIEKNLNLKIAQYCKDKLETYNGVTVFMTRTSDVYVGLEDRVKSAVNAGADVFISFHINETAGATGFEVWVQNDSSWRSYLHTESSALGSAVLAKLEKLGLKNRGNKESDSASTKYSDGSNADRLSVLRNSRYNNLPAILIEHGFIDGSSSDKKLLSSESGLQQMGEADAEGIASYYGLTKTPSNLLYRVHAQDYGWMSYKTDGQSAGTTGKSKRLESIQISRGSKISSSISGSISYRVHIQDIGWQEWKSDGALAGTTGQSKRLEAIQIELTGELANKYDIYYRVHAQDYGWLGWAKNGESAGTEGMSKRLESIQIVLCEKGTTPSSYDSSATAFYQTWLSGSAHIQDIGWKSYSTYSASGTLSVGTTGKSKRLEGVKISLPSSSVSGATGSIRYRSHIQNIGWQGWKSNGALSGTTGQSKRLEAIQIELTGELANKYDIYYRVHAQDYGWLGWTKNGESAGTEGYSKRLEKVEIKLVAKGTTPSWYDSSKTAFYNANSTKIMGASQGTVSQMVKVFNAAGKKYPSSVYGSLGAANITQFCTLVKKAAEAEGVRAEVLFAQAMWETGWLQFTGDVKAKQCNFGGLGATGGGASGASFVNVYTGLLAQSQHLKAYASTAALNETCVDPRFDLVTRGSATTLEELNGKWAVPGTNYGQNIYAIVKKVLAA